MQSYASNRSTKKRIDFILCCLLCQELGVANGLGDQLNLPGTYHHVHNLHKCARQRRTARLALPQLLSLKILLMMFLNSVEFDDHLFLRL